MIINESTLKHLSNPFCKYQNFLGCLGALKIIKDGWETEAIPEFLNKNVQKLGFLAKFFGKEL